MIKNVEPFFDWLISKTINVICVQETHCTFSEIESWQTCGKVLVDAKVVGIVE